MPAFEMPIEADGAMVDLVVASSEPDVLTWRTAGQPIPAPVTVRALLDTGAEITCIDRQALAPLLTPGVQPLRFVFVNTPATGGTNLQCEYGVSLTILHPSGTAADHLHLPDHPVVEQDLPGLGYQALIGRDVLACVDSFDFRGKKGTFSLSY